jgi:hypothetical protein
MQKPEAWSLDCDVHGPSRVTRRWTVKEVPYGTFPDYADGGPFLVAHGVWSTLTNPVSNSLHDMEGPTRLDIVKFDQNGITGDKHPLRGSVYPTDVEADRAAYEAGLLAYVVPVEDEERFGVADWPCTTR